MKREVHTFNKVILKIPYTEISEEDKDCARRWLDILQGYVTYSRADKCLYEMCLKVLGL